MFYRFLLTPVFDCHLYKSHGNSNTISDQSVLNSDRKVSVLAETETEYSAEYSSDTKCSVFFDYSVSAEYSAPNVYRNRNYRNH